jgi:hypothetical protein
MKINKLLIFFVIIGCILAVGYFAKSFTSNTTGENTTLKNSSINNSTTPSDVKTVVSNPGQIIISIGGYNALLPVAIDDKISGNVTKGKPLTLTLSGGIHTVKLCSGTVCETADVNIIPAMKTTIDFEERLNKDLPQGPLNVSIGDYDATLPVYIDDLSAGMVSSGKPLVQMISVVNHSVKICTDDKCYTSDVEVRLLANQTMVDFGDQLKSGIEQGDLMVSIGGYEATLPVFVDNKRIGFASQGTPLAVKINTGFHDVKVCSGIVCENGTVEIKFGKQAFVDFGAQLIKDVEFPTPTVRIVDSSMSGSTLLVDVEFINPNKTDLTMTATVSCVYTYVDSEHVRQSTSTKGVISKLVKAGDRTTQTMNLYFSGGSYFIASEPVVLDVTTK